MSAISSATAPRWDGYSATLESGTSTRATWRSSCAREMSSRAWSCGVMENLSLGQRAVEGRSTEVATFPYVTL